MLLMTGAGSMDSMGFGDMDVIELGLLMDTDTKELPTAVPGPTTTVNDVRDAIEHDDAIVPLLKRKLWREDLLTGNAMEHVVFALANPGGKVNIMLPLAAKACDN